MRNILVGIICFLFVSCQVYGDHYIDISDKDKFNELKSAVVLITTEITQDVRQPDGNPFDKFLQPDNNDQKTEPKLPVNPEDLNPNNSNHLTVEDEAPTVPSGMGTGFFIDEHHIVTNYHVVKQRGDGKANIKIYSYNYPFVIEDVTLIGYDAEIDIAVLRINKKLEHSILQWETERPFAGQESWAIGHGAGQIWSVTYGIISSTYRPNYSASTFIHYWQTDTVINSGNSGGPLIDANGHVIGVNTLIISPTKYYVGYGYTVPAALAKRVAEQIIETGYHIKPSIGIMMGSVDNEEQYLQLVEKGITSILEIKEVIADSPAHHYGVQTGDIITKVDGVEISVTPEVIEVLWTKMPGDELDLEIYRDGEIITITIVLGQSAPAEPRDFSLGR
jgi:S1-C subfamily serine protease